MRRFAPFAAGIILASALVPGDLFAHQLTAPSSVTADEAGHFAYEVTLLVESVTALAWFEIDGTDNTDIGHLIFDGFCLGELELGAHVVPITGNLVDPASAASVQYLHYLCDGWEGEVATAILPFSVATETRTWGAVKSLYR